MRHDCSSPAGRDHSLFVAEVSSNHNRELARCLEFVDVAARAGCDAVKFQLFRVRELFAPEVLAKREGHRKREEWELPVAFLPAIAERCRTAGVRFGCTPFYLEAVEQLRPHVDFYKVASYELLWRDLLAACAATGKPLVLSTGLADLDEVREAVEVVRRAGCADLTLLHCVSGYPTPPDQCNLAAIETLRESLRCPVGWSDHSVAPEVVLRAVRRWKAAMVEFHLDLEGKGREFDVGHCWLPERIAPVIVAARRPIEATEEARAAEARHESDGSALKAPSPIEQVERQWRADPSDGLRPLMHMRKEFPD